MVRKGSKIKGTGPPLWPPSTKMGRRETHLLLEIALPENISKIMADIGRAYTHYYDRTYQNYQYSSSRFYCQGVSDGITIEDPCYQP